MRYNMKFTEYYNLNESIVIKAYHGSRENKIKDFNVRDSEALRVSGIYFSKNKEEAKKYTKIKGIQDENRITTVEITFKNPADREVLDKLGYRLNGMEMKNKLISMGYDGVIDDFMDEIVVFNKNQIKVLDV